MHIRQAHEDEVATLSAVAFESKAHWSYSETQLEAWRGELSVSRDAVASGLTWVAEEESAIVGFFVLVPSSPNWTLEHFWVSPRSMGRGVGRLLLARAVELAADAFAPAIAIDADPHAERFYLACGASRVGSLPAPIVGEPLRERPQLLLSTQPPAPSLKRQ